MDKRNAELTPRCRGWGCFQKDWCARWDQSPPQDVEVFDTSPIDQFGECPYFVEGSPQNNPPSDE